MHSKTLLFGSVFGFVCREELFQMTTYTGSLQNCAIERLEYSSLFLLRRPMRVRLNLPNLLAHSTVYCTEPAGHSMQTWSANAYEQPKLLAQ